MADYDKMMEVLDNMQTQLQPMVEQISNRPKLSDKQYNTLRKKIKSLRNDWAVTLGNNLEAAINSQLENDVITKATFNKAMKFKKQFELSLKELEGFLSQVSRIK